MNNIIHKCAGETPTSREIYQALIKESKMGGKKKVTFFQTGKSGCGSYSLANLFNEPAFIEGVQTQTTGENTADLNKKMSIIKPDIYLEPYFHTNFHLKAYNRLTCPSLFEILWEKVTSNAKENHARPFLFSYRRVSGIHHCIAVIHNLKDDLFYVVDSMAPEVMKFKIEDLLIRYHVVSVDIFCMWDAPDQERDIFIDKSFFRHIFNETE